ncbi:aminoglycoside phosphotransferase family protein [Nocardioides sp. LMS-CY]|uniref:phosphotransferase n=1 Tax=Nocardioides sp. (strain LMS-CY) TaxID=2840457 RepID=UPI001BFFF3AA|nr:phosphotransferase [Nocardioides sp. LMS-CY]QWF20080.1 aminoglycoside phosphotransferase family protein [Nocardioides sp. LMS-CY]
MWQPEPGWHPLPGGSGASTVGVWRTVVGDQPVAVKRLAAPTPGDPDELSDPRHFAYWRRAADVVAVGTVDDTPGLRGPRLGAVEEDASGITITQEWVEDASSSGLFCAHALGRFAGAQLAPAPWLARNQLRDRLTRVERSGGWQTLARTTVADVADHLWSRRVELLGAVDALVQVPQHGDAVPANLLGRSADDVVAIDWATLGTGPVGADLGYFALAAREELEPLVDAYLLGLPGGLATREEVMLGARVTTVYTVLNRAEWALARAARGEGALAGKFRHPAVAPYLRALQRQFPHIEALVQG